MAKKSNLMRSFINKLIGIGIFLVVMLLLNIIANSAKEPLFSKFVGFLNGNILFILGIFVIFFLADFFLYFNFPLNLPGPAADGFGCVAITLFVVNVLKFILAQGNIRWVTLAWIEYLIYAIVFLIAALPGYVHIFTRYFRGRKYKREADIDEDEE